MCQSRDRARARWISWLAERNSLYSLLGGRARTVTFSSSLREQTALRGSPRVFVAVVGPVRLIPTGPAMGKELRSTITGYAKPFYGAAAYRNRRKAESPGVISREIRTRRFFDWKKEKWKSSSRPEHVVSRIVKGTYNEGFSQTKLRICNWLTEYVIFVVLSEII